MGIDLDKILKITLSGLRNGEEEEVVGLIAACGLPVEDLTPDKLRHFVVARKGDHPVGVVGIDISGDNSLLRSLAVSEAYRGRGIAKKLVASLERYAMSHRIDTLYLLTTSAVKFFSGLGYAEIERSDVPDEIQATREFTSLCSETDACMRKKLSVSKLT